MAKGSPATQYFVWAQSAGGTFSDKVRATAVQGNCVYVADSCGSPVVLTHYPNPARTEVYAHLPAATFTLRDALSRSVRTGRLQPARATGWARCRSRGGRRGCT
ncbi:hypothetical protein [Hymenobacter sp. 15J16-1T3B]|uniref:hypothetical protein n=1 Tax=Hymenobacter sp. 15J16-1T3B TaxID=2886941 RepID=UPI001D12A73B|nr:hypothetical protein [Hymenobacter sp. 15J16-1T3B]